MDLLQEHFEFQQLLVQVRTDEFGMFRKYLVIFFVESGKVQDLQNIINLAGFFFRDRTSNGAKDRFYIRRIIFEATGVQAFTVIKAFYNLFAFQKTLNREPEVFQDLYYNRE